MVKQRLRIGIHHVIGRCHRRQADAGAATANGTRHGLHHFQQQAGSVFNAAAIGVGALVAAGLQKLVQQIAVGGVYFDAVKPGFDGGQRSAAVVVHDAGQLVQRQRARL